MLLQIDQEKKDDDDITNVCVKTWLDTRFSEIETKMKGLNIIEPEP